MPTWKKVVVSGSSAELSTLKVDNLTSGSVVIGGGNVSDLSTRAINGTGNIVATSGASGVSMTGSFTGSFTGTIIANIANADTASKVIVTDTTTGTGPYYVAFTDGTTGARSVLVDSAALTFNATTNVLTTTASFATTASRAISSETATSASFASTSSLPLRGLITASSAGSTITFTKGDNTTFNVTLTTATSATASYVTSSGVDGPFGMNSILSASFAVSASRAVSALSASYALSTTNTATASRVENALTFGNGIVATVGSKTYDGSAAVTVAVGQGALISTSSLLVSVNTSSLSANQIPKFSNNALSGSNISDTGTQVQVGSGATSGLSVAAGGVNVTGNSTFNNNVVIAGDLSVNGTTTFINTDNLYVEDRFVLLASGSTTLGDGGLIVQYNSAGSGSAMYVEASSTGTYGRWAVAYDVIGTSTTATPDEYVVTAKIGQASNPSAAPTWGGATNGTGNVWITNGGDIFIYS